MDGVPCQFTLFLCPKALTNENRACMVRCQFLSLVPQLLNKVSVEQRQGCRLHDYVLSTGCDLLSAGRTHCRCGLHM
jgi:hypothetical protein